MSDKLAQTVTAFEQWRLEKTGKSSSTPVNLRKQAVALLTHYSKIQHQRRCVLVARNSNVGDSNINRLSHKPSLFPWQC